jgi:hypothetical protein
MDLRTLADFEKEMPLILSLTELQNELSEFNIVHGLAPEVDHPDQFDTEDTVVDDAAVMDLAADRTERFSPSDDDPADGHRKHEAVQRSVRSVAPSLPLASASLLDQARCRVAAAGLNDACESGSVAIASAVNAQPDSEPAVPASAAPKSAAIDDLTFSRLFTSLRQRKAGT